MPELIRGASAILDGVDCIYVADVLAAALQARAQRDGGVPPRLQAIAKVVQAAALQARMELLSGSDSGTERFRNEALEAACVTSTTWLTVEATATLLGQSTSYVRRLCRQRTLRGVRPDGKGAWLIDEAAVLDRLGERDNEAA